MAPQKVRIVIRKDMAGMADTSGARIRCAAKWIRQNLRGEAMGSLFHELVHVVQQYGRGPRGSARPPGWLTEGIADYLRWYQFEPQARGAAISRAGLAEARYNGSYRVTANFLHWVTEHHDPDLVRHLNAALREGRYDEGLWKQRTGRTAPELEADWKRSLEQSLEAGTARATR